MPPMFRFTLRRALIAIALLALFLGWLRPDRATTRGNPVQSVVEFRPMWPFRSIVMARYKAPGTRAMYNFQFEFND